MRHPLLVCVLVASAIPLGCIRNFGTGGTGELVIPEKTLRQIDATEMAKISTAPPTTQGTPTTAPATQPAAEIHLSITECRQIALTNNLDLRVELINPTLARYTLSAEEARFEALFVANINHAITDAPTASRLNSAQSKNTSADVGVQIPLRTGGVINLSVPMNRNETNNEFATLNPAYNADYAAAISQPLLRGFGFGVNAQPIRIAFYNWQRSEAQTKLAVIRDLANVDRVYWRLQASRRVLDVRKQQHDLADVQLQRARRLVRSGIAAEPEIVRAEAGVADSVEQIIIAENLVRDAQRELKRVLNKPGLEMSTDTIIIPDTEPSPLYYKLDSEQLVQTALKQRMEMIDQELRIAQENSNVSFARNGLLPVLTLDYTYNINGLGPTLGDAFSMAGNHDFEDHRIGVRLEVPIGNEAARSRYRFALASRLQSYASKDQQASLITQEVLNTLDQLEASWQQILAATQRVVLNKRLLEVEIRQFNLGLRTSTDVLNAQTTLANAASDEIVALTQYQIAQVDLAFATGTVLGASRVNWEPIPAPPH